MSSPADHLTPPPSRILVRGVNWLGDAVMTTPALTRLRERFPRTQISLLTVAKLAPLWQAHPAVNEIITFDPAEGVWSIGRRLRQNRFDVALVLPNSPRSAFETWLGRVPLRVGFARPWRNWLLTHAIESYPGQAQMRKRSKGEILRLLEVPGKASDRNGYNTAAHHIHHYLHLTATLGASAAPLAPRLCVEPADTLSTLQKFGLQARQGTSGAPLLGLNPGAEYGPAKRWPATNFIAAASEIQRRTGCQWLIFGGAGDLALAEEISSGIQGGRPTGTTMPNVVNVAGKTSLRELMALMTLCRVVLTNDTGPMHVAAALGIPVVVPFGSTSPELTGPGLPGDPLHHLLKSTAPCAPCFLRTCPVDLRCLTGIPVEQVVSAVLKATATRPCA